jgi:hypothetical protein
MEKVRSVAFFFNMEQVIGVIWRSFEKKNFFLNMVKVRGMC